MSEAPPADLRLRAPRPEEAERLGYLFRTVPVPAGAQVLAAVKSRPLERFVAAAAWWPEGHVGRFQLVCQPGVVRAAVAGLLVAGVAEGARRAGMGSLQYATLLTDDDLWLGLLRGHGFECVHSERSFELAYREAWRRVTQLYQRHRSQIPGSWRTEAIRGQPPEAVLELMAPHRLMPLPEVRAYWTAHSQPGFDLELSCILWDGPRPWGVFLVRRLGDGLYIDVQVVRESNPRLRSLGDLLLLYHAAQRVAADGPLRWIWFRSGQAEHRQTANLAFRMGGRELARSHLLAKALGDPRKAA